MTYRAFLILSLWLFSFTKASAGLTEYKAAILSVCKQTPSLLIKKSALEFSSKNDCGQVFIKQLLARCPELQCEDLKQNYKRNMVGRSGSVVGE